MGLILTTGGRRLKVQNFKSNLVVLKNLETNEQRDAELADLTRRIHTGQIVIEGSSTTLPTTHNDSVKKAYEIAVRGESPIAVAEMLSLHKWVIALRRAGFDVIVNKPWVRTAMRRLGNKEMQGVKQFSIHTLVKADRKLRAANNDPLCLLPQFSQRGGKGLKRIQTMSEQFTKKEILRLQEKECRRERIVYTSILQSINVQIRQYNRDFPENATKFVSLSTITRRVKSELGAKEISLRNRGIHITNKAYRENGYARDTAEFPLEVVEFDDKRTGVFLISLKTGLPWGQAFVTSGICQATLSITGCNLSHKHRSIESAMGAIIHTLLPKSKNDLGMEFCQMPWLPFGRPGTTLLDNARYNFSKGMESQSAMHGFILSSVQPYTPTAKSSIEHFNDCIGNDFCPTIPGWRGEKGDTESIKDGMNAAILDVTQFRQLFFKWVTEIYSVKPGETGMSPNERWAKFYSNHQPAVRWSKDQLELMRLIPIQLTFRDSGGLERQNLRYQSQQLSELRQRVGYKAKLQAFRDPEDLSYLLVVSPISNQHFRVPCVEKPYLYEGVTEYQQCLLRKLLREKGITHPSLSQLVDARRELVLLTAQLARSNKLILRQQREQIGKVIDVNDAYKNEQGSPEINEKTNLKQSTIVISELEHFMQELDIVELNLEEESWE